MKPVVQLDRPECSGSLFVPAAAERRRDERHASLLRVGMIEAEFGRRLCLIKNISSSGLRAQVDWPVAPGSIAAVALKSEQKIAGRIVWAKDDHVGLNFEEPIDVADALSGNVSAAGYRPRPPRLPVRCFATLRSGARVYRGTIVDISQGGTKIELDRAIEPGQVVVSLQGMEPIHGLVRWSDERHSGVAFNESIPFRRLSGWYARLAEQASLESRPAGGYA